MQDQQPQQGQPGWTFSPNATGGTTSPQQVAPEQVQQPQPAAQQPTPQAPQVAEQVSQPEQQPELAPTGDAITWSASEFVEHQKSAGWYMATLGASMLAIAIVYFVTKDIFSVVVLTILAVVFLVFAGRKPRTLTYSLQGNSIKVGEKAYNLSNFKSFSLSDDGPIHSISFLPMKRFHAPLTIYFAPEDEDRIGNYLSNELPFEDRPPDAVDNLMKRIRF